MFKVLFITRDYLKGHGGGVYASRAYINAFAEIADEMTLVYPVKEGAEAEGISKKIKSYYTIDYNFPIVVKFVRAVIGKISAIRSLPNDFFDKKKYDIVVFNFSCVSQGLLKRFKKTGMKVITIHHNFELEYLKDNCPKILYVPRMLATHSVERDTVRLSDLNLTLTSQDKQSLINVYNGNKNNFEVISVFESIPQTLVEIPKRKNEIPTFIITGDLRYPQSYQSVLKWMDEYYPILKQEIPNSHLIIAGRDPSKVIVDKCYLLGIELIPSPNDMNEVLVRGDYYICPTNLGSGLKLRILDGLKWGMQVITHEVSARGYDHLVEEGVILSYKDKESFRDSLIRMISKPLSRKDVQNKYQTVFSFESGVNNLKLILLNHHFL